MEIFFQEEGKAERKTIADTLSGENSAVIYGQPSATAAQQDLMWDAEMMYVCYGFLL
jgi:hypothetical protein